MRQLLLSALLLLGVAACSEKKSDAPAPEVRTAEVKAPEAEKPTADTASGADASAEPAAAAPATALDPCKLFDASDLEALLGKDAKHENIGEEQCKLKGANGEYEIAVRAQNAKREMDDWRTMSMPATKPLSGVGEEAFASTEGAPVIILRKGDRAARVSASGIRPTAPMKGKEGVERLAKRVAEKL